MTEVLVSDDEDDRIVVEANRNCTVDGVNLKQGARYKVPATDGVEQAFMSGGIDIIGKADDE